MRALGQLFLDVVYRVLIIGLGFGLSVSAGNLVVAAFPQASTLLSSGFHPYAVIVCVLLSCSVLEVFLPLRTITDSDLAYRHDSPRTAAALSTMALPQLIGLGVGVWLACPPAFVLWALPLAMGARLLIGLRRWHLPSLLRAGSVSTITTAGLSVHDSELVSEALVQTHLTRTTRTDRFPRMNPVALWGRRLRRRWRTLAALWVLPTVWTLALLWPHPALAGIVLMLGQLCATASMLRSTRFGDVAPSGALGGVALAGGTILSTALFGFFFHTNLLDVLVYATGFAVGAWQRSQPRSITGEATGGLTDSGYVMTINHYYAAGLVVPLCCVAFSFLT